MVTAGSALEYLITRNFSNITEIRHADYANSSSGSLDALNSTGTLIAGNETTVTAAGAEVLGVAAGTYDFLIASAPAADSFNGLAAGQTGFGGGDILATVGGDTLAAFWAAGAAPGGANSGVATFPANRLLFNIDNDPNTGNNGINDINNMSTAGAAALVSAINFASWLACSRIRCRSSSSLD